MKANELRIGNWIIIDGIGETITTGINIAEWDALNEVQLCEPIPLTEEWLLKMGLIEDGLNIMLFGDYDIWFERVGNELYLKTECSSRKIEFVHIAQNIKFALTGQELTLQQTPPEPPQ